MDFSTITLEQSIFNEQNICLVFIITMFYMILVFNANSVDSDQMLYSAGSDLGLHYLPMSLLWDARHNWVVDSHYLGPRNSLKCFKISVPRHIRFAELRKI